MKKLMLLLLFIPVFAQAQIITTFAGISTSGFSGDGGPATNASLNYPVGMAIDDSGSLFVVDQNNKRIRKINVAGTITTFAGNGYSGFSDDGGMATNATLSDPQNIVIDGMGNIYLTDYGNSRVRKINTSGIISTIAGNGSGLIVGMEDPPQMQDWNHQQE